MPTPVIVVAFIFLSMIIPALGEPVPNRTGKEMSQQFINDETFTELKSLKDIPQGVRDEFVKVSHGPTFMADSKQIFAVGCTRALMIFVDLFRSFECQANTDV